MDLNRTQRTQGFLSKPSVQHAAATTDKKHTVFATYMLVTQQWQPPTDATAPLECWVHRGPRKSRPPGWGLGRSGTPLRLEHGAGLAGRCPRTCSRSQARRRRCCHPLRLVGWREIRTRPRTAKEWAWKMPERRKIDVWIARKGVDVVGTTRPRRHSPRSNR